MEEEVKQDSLEEVKHKLLEIMKFGLSSCMAKNINNLL